MEMTLEGAAARAEDQLRQQALRQEQPTQESPLEGWILDTRDQSLSIMAQAFERANISYRDRPAGRKP